jgi:hypothetical protein
MLIQQHQPGLAVLQYIVPIFIFPQLLLQLLSTTNRMSSGSIKLIGTFIVITGTQQGDTSCGVLQMPSLQY